MVDTTTRHNWKEGDWVVYVGLISSPKGEAGGRRVLGMSRTIAACGLRVVIATADAPQTSGTLAPTTSGATEGVSLHGTGEYDRSWGALRKMHYLFWSRGARTLDWLDQQPTKPRAVIVYSPSVPLLARLLPWSRQHHVALLCDVVEWYCATHLPGGYVGPFFWSNEYTMRRQIPRCHGIIGISRLLCDYYQSKGCPVLRVPPTLDLAAVEPRLKVDEPHDRISLVYAGIPGKKDLLGNALRALEQVDPDGARFRLHILGPQEAQICHLYPPYPRRAVEIHGRLAHDETLQQVRAADFSILLRPNQRYANAGFPTKVVESLSCGTPVICNLTSDLGEYIHDGAEGIICPDHSPEAFAGALGKIARLSNEQLNTMRAAARTRAQRSFDSLCHVEAMRQFLNAVLSRAAGSN